MGCQLDLSEPAKGNAIHGLTRWAGWQISENEPGRVLLRHCCTDGPATRSAWSSRLITG